MDDMGMQTIGGLANTYTGLRLAQHLEADEHNQAEGRRICVSSAARVWLSICAGEVKKMRGSL
jgi:hypothetical protein